MMDGASLRLPDFIAVGPPRTATTWLDQVMRGHVGLPAGVKETQFFIWRYSQGIEWYAAHFRDCPANLPAGEIAPTYFASPEALERIARHIPRCKIICTLRDPVERTYSHYRLWRKIGVVKGPFDYVCAHRKELISYSRYAPHLKAWREKFEPENVLVCINDDLETAPQAYLDRICDFIGIASIRLDKSPLADEKTNTVTHAPRSGKLAQNARHVADWLNAHRAYRTSRALEWLGIWRLCYEGGAEFSPLTPEQDARLREEFLPDVEALEELLQRDLSAWKPRSQIVSRLSALAPSQQS
jgi:hypothetical protein